MGADERRRGDQATRPRTAKYCVWREGNEQRERGGGYADEKLRPEKRVRYLVLPSKTLIHQTQTNKGLHGFSEGAAFFMIVWRPGGWRVASLDANRRLALVLVDTYVQVSYYDRG